MIRWGRTPRLLRRPQMESRKLHAKHVPRGTSDAVTIESNNANGRKWHGMLPKMRGYEKAKKNEGYQGTFKQWHLENQRIRTTGTLPYISTLKHKDVPEDSDMIRWRFLYQLPDARSRYGTSRFAILDGRDLGRVKISFTLPARLKKDEELWLRPYFDPIVRCLRLQRRDGSDYPFRRDLHTLATLKELRSILHLAHGEGLLESVPDDRLSSLRFDTARDSGFAVHCNIQRVPGPRCEVHLRFRHKGVIDKYKIRFRPIVPPDQQAVTFFPYVGKSGLLHLWDIAKGSNLKLRLSGLPVSGFEPSHVRQRWPKLFDLAQSEGFWAEEASCDNKVCLL
ncbi:hypothetical protein FRB95_006050 [Tulasnella sp. JGI-2019a]|nr:hypothetical protein FRB95_006050 [Tulasnella sp. JGI-2019a]